MNEIFRMSRTLGGKTRCFFHASHEMNDQQNLIPPGTAQAGTNAPLSNRRDWKYFDEKLAELRVNDVINIIARGRLLIEAP